MTNQHQNKGKGKPKPAFDKSNPILEAFSKMSEELDDKHDRHERLIKISRDITIQSKKIIFFLHTVDPSKNNKEKVLEEAKQRLDKIVTTNFHAIALELKNMDQYQYLRAFTFGLQEFIEAYSFYDYLKGNSLTSCEEIQKNLIFDDDGQQIKCLVPPFEHILGLGDLTGEVMRFCINSLGSGNVDGCVNACKFLQTINTGFMSIGHLHSRDFGQKVSTMKQSVQKCEMVCYHIKVRGSEATKLGATGALPNLIDAREAEKDADEGFY